MFREVFSCVYLLCFQISKIHLSTLYNKIFYSHNRSMRLLAIKMGMSLSEHGLRTGIIRQVCFIKESWILGSIILIPIFKTFRLTNVYFFHDIYILWWSINYTICVVCFVLFFVLNADGFWCNFYRASHLIALK